MFHPAAASQRKMTKNLNDTRKSALFLILSTAGTLNQQHISKKNIVGRSFPSEKLYDVNIFLAFYRKILSIYLLVYFFPGRDTSFFCCRITKRKHHNTGAGVSVAVSWTWTRPKELLGCTSGQEAHAKSPPRTTAPWGGALLPSQASFPHALCREWPAYPILVCSQFSFRYHFPFGSRFLHLIFCLWILMHQNPGSSSTLFAAWHGLP